MNLLDRYVVRQFLVTALFAMVAVTAIFVVVDSMEKLDNFIDRQATAAVVARYYLYFIPEIIKLITPVAMLLASLFVTARLSTQNEITAMKACGVSLYRLMVPYAVVALLVTGVSIWFNGWIVPVANRAKIDIERLYLGSNNAGATATDLYIQEAPTRIVSLGFYDDGRASAQRVSLQEFSNADLTVMTHRIDAASMTWDSTARAWIFHSGTQRWFAGGRERMEQFAVRPAGRLQFTPDELRKKQEKPDEMDYFTLREFIGRQQRAGQDVNRWLVDFYSKVSFPFATFIVVLFGVPFSSVRRRGGAGVQLGISLLICFIYLIVMKVSQVFGYNGDVNPLLTAWMANIGFFAAAVVVVLRVKK